MKKNIILLVIILVIGLTGCAKRVSLTEDESVQVAEYAAGVVLKHDENYKEALVYTLPTPSPTPEPTPLGEPIATKDDNIADKNENNQNSGMTSETNGKPKGVDYVEISEIFRERDYKITYSNSQFYDSYPKNAEQEYFVVNAGKNKKLLVISFSIKNLSNEKRIINHLESNVKYQLELKNQMMKPSFTLLLNDIQYMDIEIDKGASKEAVLVFQMDKETNMNELTLYISKTNKEGVVEKTSKLQLK